MPTTDIYTIYLYYFPEKGKTRMYEWWDYTEKITFDDLKDKMKDIAKGAFKNNKDLPYIDDRNCMIMRRKSYVVFVVNKKYWQAPASYSIDITGTNYHGQAITGKHTFGDKINDFEANLGFLGLSDKHVIIYCENLIASSTGEPWEKGEREEFSFKLPFQGLAREGRGPDSGGTNMGPPVPPPSGRK